MVCYNLEKYLLPYSKHLPSPILIWFRFEMSFSDEKCSQVSFLLYHKVPVTIRSFLRAIYQLSLIILINTWVRLHTLISLFLIHNLAVVFWCPKGSVVEKNFWFGFKTDYSNLFPKSYNSKFFFLLFQKMALYNMALNFFSQWLRKFEQYLESSEIYGK